MFMGRLAGVNLVPTSGIKKGPHALAQRSKNLTFFFDDHPTAATRETRNDRSGIPAVGGRQSGRSHRTDQADDRDARGEVNRD
jgi:hypothetical protein